MSLAADEIRQKLLTQEGRESFDLVNALRPDWTVFEAANGIYMSASIEWRPSGGNRTMALSTGWASSYDDGAVKQAQALIQAARTTNAIIVVNRGTARKAEYTLDRSNLCLMRMPADY